MKKKTPSKSIRANVLGWVNEALKHLVQLSNVQFCELCIRSKISSTVSEYPKQLSSPRCEDVKSLKRRIESGFIT